ncbi:hypothetical protein ElyMa_001867000 [Elysia marginata]|uniref:DOMON domain-containing protein n=1 Tax=Elysia marginata TaxID=1093978 RepID=A0AAV4EP36_9GAST|nr:hypothetical protein ElyMa_001867000 [Elysia marginata]
MQSVIAAVFLLLASQAVSAQICQAPKSEQVFYLTSGMADFFVANDFDQGKILIVFKSDNGVGDHWSIVDIVSGITYINTVEKGCVYRQFSQEQNEIFYQCLPDDASLERSGDVDFYYMTRPEFTWLVGMKPVEGTEFYFRHFSRFYDENVVDKEITFGVTYKYSLGISDPTIFDKDLSVCVEAPLGQQSY